MNDDHAIDNIISDIEWVQLEKLIMDELVYTPWQFMDEIIWKMIE